VGRTAFQFGLALIVFGCAAARGSESAAVIFQKGAAALAAEDYPTAEGSFQAVLKLEPRNVGAMGNLGVVYSRSRRFSEAISIYKRALRIAPADKFIATNLGLAYVRQEQFADALPIFEKLAAAPSNLQARELLATCRLALGEYKSAVAALQPLLAAEPANPGALYLLGVALTRLKRPEEAHEAFAKMMAAVSPAQANFLMGKASYETERFIEAVDFFRKVLQADPAFDGAHRELGKALISLNDDENAEKELREAPPDDFEALYFLGGLLARTRPAEAIPILEKARTLAPDMWGPPYYLGRIYVDQGRTTEALSLLERAAKLNPDESAIQYQLGRAFQKAGREADAKAAFDRVTKIKNRSRP